MADGYWGVRDKRFREIARPVDLLGACRIALLRLLAFQTVIDKEPALARSQRREPASATQRPCGPSRGSATGAPASAARRAGPGVINPLL
jgi:hypothetical protein